MKKLVVICLLMLFFSCGQEQNNTPESTQEPTSYKLTKNEINSINITEFELDAKVKKITQDWGKYNELSNIIDNVKNGDTSFFMGNHETLEALLNDFKTSLPKQLNSPSIEARIVSLENAFYKFESLINLSNSKQDAITESLKTLLESFSNLKFQMNKKLERESQKIEKPV
ncbi:hypothetical protein [Mangrovimonas spongiae]|uniref:Uncharacterized protein n=1 Tax=Mangrovimonas spongiae TaxID=2494697 RepID=A0A428K4M8_9FLAO|nr:hypothetical protein [Mangrovimonas spongiae]RSK41361.1 hypothetical protein EJA19_00365 [Mangrovimonas spongiae]